VNLTVILYDEALSMCVDTKLGALNNANVLELYSDQCRKPTCARRKKIVFAHVIRWQSFAGGNTDVSHRYSKLWQSWGSLVFVISVFRIQRTSSLLGF